MSSKGDKPEKASGSKMLKKAKSFRDDVKGLIRRRPSSSSQDASLSESRVKSQRVRSGKALSRTTSLSDGTRSDKLSSEEDAKKSKDVSKKKDVDKLQEEVDKVYRSLKYIQAVVDHEKLQVIPNTATVVLETVMDVFTLLGNFFLQQDSTILVSRHNKVCQCLARFIQWADEILLHGDKALNKKNAHDVISALSDGVEELKEISINKLQDRKLNQVVKPTSPETIHSHPENAKRSSLPDIPLTPREKEILDNTVDIGIYDNTPFTTSRSSDSISNHSRKEPPDLGELPPPPKPPLPADSELVHRLISQHSQEEVPIGHPPPIPVKENRRSLTNTMEMLSGSVSQSPRNSGVLSGYASPSQSPHNSVVFTSAATSSNQSPHSSVVFSDISKSPSQSPHSSVIMIGPVTPNQSPHSSVIYNTSQASELSSSLGLTTPECSSPRSVSPLSHSPSSSMGSGLNRSSEDLLTSASQRNSRANSFSHAQSEGQLGNVFTVMNKSISQSEGTVDQINQLTMEIDKLTSNIATMTNRNKTTVTAPPLPTKKLNRLPSQYDNIDGVQITSSTTTSRRTVVSEHRMSSSSTSSSQSFSGFQMQKSNVMTYQTSSQETYSSSETFSSASHSSLESLPKPPPLPPKKRHIQAYMQTFGAYTQPQPVADCIYSRHSINFYEAQWHQHQMEIHQPLYPRSNTISVISDISSDSSFSSSAPNSPAIPPLPTKRKSDVNRSSLVSNTSLQSDTSVEYPREKAVSMVEGPTQVTTPEGDLKRSSAPPGQIKEKQLVEPSSPGSPKMEIQKDADSDFAELNPLDDIDVSDQLIKKKETEDGPEIRGGSIDALVVHATSVGKAAFMYQEAFLTTYRTFISPKQLIDKLLYRFHKFQHASEKKKKVSRNAFSLLIRVIDELSPKELEDDITEKIMTLVFELLCQGDLMLAKVLRKKIIEKCESLKLPADPLTSMTFTSSITLKSSPSDLLLHKSHDIAEQMTLLDADLFLKIEFMSVLDWSRRSDPKQMINEVSLWAREQSEELTPNLTEFTEHFNKMSYWCRTQILIHEDAKDREKYFLKFIKIMRHLRKLNNFNSYLAILSAVDSAPIRRLEWPRQNLEALKEFCQLIDSSGSFRAYRQALAETEPPCIPYIGLILQDLTFINIGNQDLLPDGNINFAKRWQQFTILENMRRFKKCDFNLKRQEKIVAVFNGFDDYLSEESLWQISEKIKPRGGAKKKVEQSDS